MTDLTRIDDGPVATVYSGHRAGVPVAVKVFPKRFDKRTMSSFSKEQAKLATVRRVTSILMVDGVEELPTGESALRMELCTQSLAALVERVGQLAATDVATLGCAMATALAAAHSVGVVHGGVSPSNVLFRDNGEPVVGDFGVTLRQAFTRDPLHAIEYLPPETLRTGTLNELTDLYGLGAVLHFALTGRSPHPGRLGEQPGERVLRILGEPVPAINRQDVPVGLSTLVARLLATTPNRRPQDAAQVADHLTAMLPNPPTQPPTEDWDDFDAPAPSPPPPAREDPLDFDDFATRPGWPSRRPPTPWQPTPGPGRPAMAPPVPPAPGLGYGPPPVPVNTRPPRPAEAPPIATRQPAPALQPVSLEQPAPTRPAREGLPSARPERPAPEPVQLAPTVPEPTVPKPAAPELAVPERAVAPELPAPGLAASAPAAPGPAAFESTAPESATSEPTADFDSATSEPTALGLAGSEPAGPTPAVAEPAALEPVSPAAPTVPESATPEPVSADPAVLKPPVPEPAAPEQAGSEQAVVPDLPAPGPVASAPAVSAAATSASVASEAAAFESTALESATSGPNALGLAGSEPAAPTSGVSEPATPEPVAAESTVPESASSPPPVVEPAASESGAVESMASEPAVVEPAASLHAAPVSDPLLPLAPPPVSAKADGVLRPPSHAEPGPPVGGDALVTAPVATGLVLGGGRRDQDFDDDFGNVRRATVLAGPLSPPDQPHRRLIRYDLLAGAALLLALLALVPLLLLRGDPDEIPSSARLPAAGEADTAEVTVELAEPTDLTDKVQLSWKATRDLDFAVVVAAEGEKPQVLLVQRNHTMTVDIEPGLKYCFMVQATDGDQVYESEPQPLRGATCRK